MMEYSFAMYGSSFLQL